jgi:hypothetical protein
MIAMLDTLKEENNKSKKKKKKREKKPYIKKGVLGDNKQQPQCGRTSTPMACDTFFFHPSWRKGSHASKEDNNNNLDEKKSIANKKVPHS